MLRGSAFPVAAFVAVLMQAPPSPTQQHSSAGAVVTEHMQVSKAAARTASPASGEHFTGSAEVTPLFPAHAPSQTSAASITFAPGAYTAWHSHPLGQYLIVTSGVGRVQEWGGPVIEIHPGDVVWTPPNVKHWHGAAPNSPMTHIAVQDQAPGKSAQWFEPVTAAEYNAVPETK